MIILDYLFIDSCYARQVEWDTVTAHIPRGENHEGNFLGLHKATKTPNTTFIPTLLKRLTNFFKVLLNNYPPFYLRFRIESAISPCAFFNKATWRTTKSNGKFTFSQHPTIQFNLIRVNDRPFEGKVSLTKTAILTLTTRKHLHRQ
jgi:hypothetical protein